MGEVDPTAGVGRTWESVSGAWERNRRRVFEGFRHVSEWLVQQVDPRPGQTVLEVAAGPGETGFLAAERVGSDGTVLSTDLAPGMVAAARRGAEARGLGNVDCRVMDAQHLDLPEASVDAVVSRLGFMLMPDPGQAFGEVRRVLRPGGRFACAVMGAPDRNPWVSVMSTSFVSRGHVPGSGDPFGPGGIFSLADRDRDAELVRAAGFDEVTVEDLVGAMAFDDVDDYWEFIGHLAGSIAELAASLPAEELAEIKAALPGAMAPYSVGDRFELPTQLVGVVAS